VNYQDGHGRTALHWAIIHNNEALIQKLLEHSARVDIKDNKGYLPFDMN
jgi:Ankyrin repeat.